MRKSKVWILLFGLLLGLTSRGYCWTGSVPSSTTTLTITPGTAVQAGDVLTLQATVSGAGNTPILRGQVLFCNAEAFDCSGAAVLARAQLLGSGPNAGTATVKLRLGIGAHSLRASFAGTAAITGSTSTAQIVTVSAKANSGSYLTLYSTGDPGDYTLHARASFAGQADPAAAVSFIDSANANLALGQAPLSAPSVLGLYGLQQSPVSSYQWADYWLVGDWNGDGIPDEAAINQSTAEMDIFLGNGDGTSTPGPVYATGAYPGRAVAADLNADGIQDIVLLNSAGGNAGGFQVFLGVGDGSFQPPVTYLTGPISFPRDLLVSDLNGDGYPDLAVQLPTLQTVPGQNGVKTNLVAIFLGNGDGSFKPQVNYEALGTKDFTGEPGMAIADFNHDGFADILNPYSVPVNSGGVITYTYGMSLLLGNGDGTFKAVQDIPVPAGFLGTGVVAGDFNQDGKADFAAVAADGSVLYVFLGNGNGSFQMPVAYNTSIPCNPMACGMGGFSSTELALTDFTGSGKIDLVQTQQDGYFSILRGNGDGSFQTPVVSSAVTNSRGAFALGDLNGDGLMDVVAKGWYGMETLLGVWQRTATLNHVAVFGSNDPNGYCCLAQASYPGDTTYKISVSNTVELQSAQTLTATTLTTTPQTYASPGQSVTLTATVTPSTSGSATAGGQVQFYDGATALGSPVNLTGGHASLVITTLGLGAHSLNAAYTGDVSFTGSTSPAVGLTIAPPSFTLSLNPASGGVRQGQSALTVATVTPTGGLQGTVTFSCSGLPDYSACVFSPTSVTLDSTSSGRSTQVTITTFGNAMAATRMGGMGAGGLVLAVLPFGVLGLRRARRGAWRLLLALAFLPAIVLVANGCGMTNCCQTPSTTAGTYNITVTAKSTSPAVTQNAVFALTVAK